MADRLMPMMQCTSTFPVEQDGEREKEIEKTCKTITCITLLYCTVFVLQDFMYKVNCRFKVLTEVKALGILCWDAKVYAGVSIKTLVSNAALFGVRCVEDMSDAKIM